MDRFEIMMLMQDRHSDGVALAARTRDPGKYEEVVRFYTKRTDPIFNLPFLPLHGETPEEHCADEVHGNLESVVIQHFVSQYDRSEMIALIQLLDRASGCGDCAVEICKGLSLPLRELAEAWSKHHPGAKAIQYVGPEPDIG